jgi:hypothetical protein
MGCTLYFMKKKTVFWSLVTGAGGINGVRRAIQSFLQEVIYLNDFGLKSCRVVQECKINEEATWDQQPHQCLKIRHSIPVGDIGTCHKGSGFLVIIHATTNSICYVKNTRDDVPQ